MTKKTGTALAKTETDVAVGFDYGEDTGRGFEKQEGSEVAIPFLNVLQSGSPQVESNLPEGSKAGMLFNTVTQQLISGEEGTLFLPCQKQYAFVEWVPRDQGGGFVAMHKHDSDLVKDALGRNKGRTIGLKASADKDANEIVETYYMYGLVLNDAGDSAEGFAVLSFTSTKIKPYRNWITSMRMIKGKPPIFAFRTHVKTTKQKNKKGTFFNFLIEPVGGKSWVDCLLDPAKFGSLLDSAKDFEELIKSGVAQVQFEQQGQGSGEDEGEVDPDKPPF